MASRVYGIDLGTTYSCIAYVDEHGKPVVVPNAEGDLTTPSVVWYESPESVVVGRTAKEEAVIHQERVVSTIKRQMGNPDFEFTVDNQVHKPAEISAQILRKLVKDASAVTGDDIKDVVITCPAYFGVTQKEATKQAGEIAGLNVLYVIPEPVAAAIAYGITQTEDQNIMVYDLGGGTFDITLIAISAGAITAVATGGDDHLGGKNWDDAIVEYLAQEFSNQTGTPAQDLLDDLEAYQELVNDAERLKIRLSSANSVVQRVRFGAQDAKVDLTREKFDDITRPLLERTVNFTEEMLERGRSIGVDKVDCLLLVGGSTYMPQIIERMKQFPFEVKQFDPNQAVAKGAALFGYKCEIGDRIKEAVADQLGQSADSVDLDTVAPQVKAEAEREVAAKYGLAHSALQTIVNRTITNVSSRSFGIVVVTDDGARRELVSNLVLVDDQVPREMSRQYFTVDEGQLGVDLRIMQNEERTEMVELHLCEPSTPIGSGVVTFDRSLPKNSPIEVTFKLSPDGLLDVSGRDLTTGGLFKGTFETEALLSKEEVQQAKTRALAMVVS